MATSMVNLTRPLLAYSLVVLLGGCAALGPKTQGETEAVAWKATDMRLELRPVGNTNSWFYTFNLLVRESRGTGITFDEIVTTIYQPGVGPWTGTYPGTWRLEPRAAFRLPLQSTISCLSTTPNCLGTNVPVPLWRITMSGRDDQQRPVKAVMDLSLPADPPPSPDTAAQAAPFIKLR
jgi:hypothetical protein